MKSVSHYSVLFLSLFLINACAKKEEGEKRKANTTNVSGARPAGGDTAAVQDQIQQQQMLIYISSVSPTADGGEITSTIIAQSGGSTNIQTSHSGEEVATGGFTWGDKQIGVEAQCVYARDIYCGNYIISLIVKKNNVVQYQYGLKADLSNSGQSVYIYNKANALMSIDQIRNLSL